MTPSVRNRSAQRAKVISASVRALLDRHGYGITHVLGQTIR